MPSLPLMSKKEYDTTIRVQPDSYHKVQYDDVEFELNTEFFDDDMDAQMITAQMMLVDRGYIAKDDLRDNLRRSNQVAADRTNEMLEDDSDDSLGLGLDG